MKMIQNVSLWLFLFLLPVQLGKHFFFNFSYINGVRIDYLAPAIYLTDIVFLWICVLFWREIYRFVKKHYTLIAGMIAILLIHATFSSVPLLAYFSVLKIFEVLLIAVLVSKAKVQKRLMLSAFTVGALVQTFLALTQYAQKQSLQGVFYYFGERYFTLSTPGIAKASLFGEQILRPYGTFSHPNSLGGFYLLIFAYILTIRTKSGLKPLLLMLSTLLILISFSKVVIVSAICIGVIHILWNNGASLAKRGFGCIPCTLAKLIIGISVVGIFLSSHGDVLSIQKRVSLFSQAIEIIRHNLLLGTGFGHYLYAHAAYPTPYSYVFNQPVHNIFLLFLMQAGALITGLSLYVVYASRKLLMKHWQKLFLPLVAIFLTGMFDHYWLTLQQNMLLMGVVLGCALSWTPVEAR